MTEKADAQRTAVFISHATPEDNHFVRWLGAKLTAMGYEVWADVIHPHFMRFAAYVVINK